MSDVSIILAGVSAIGLLRWWLGKHPMVLGTKRCTGYARPFSGDDRRLETMHDCRALRNPMCLDGRCTLHCRELCKCNVDV